MGNATVTAVIASECVIRPCGCRAYPGQEVEITPEEYERLKNARCIIDTMSKAPDEAAYRRNPANRRVKGR